MNRSSRYAVGCWLLPLFTVTGQAPGAQEQQSKQPVLLLVHGRDVQTDTPLALRADWSSALNLGLARAGIDSTLIPDVDRRFVYYGNVYANGFQHPKCAGVTLALDGGSPPPPPKNESANPFNGVLRLAKALTLFMPSSWRYGVIMPITRDTKEYIERGVPSCSVRNIYRDSLEAQEKRPIVVLAHSQGALLTYEYQANDEGWAHPLSGFVSAGAQFGFDALMLRFGAKAQQGGDGISTPPGLGKVWYNFYDSQDAVAFSMGDRYRKSPLMRDMEEHQVHNPLEFRHTATGYLSNAVVALATADAWCKSFSQPPAGCTAVRDSVAFGRIRTEPKHRPDLWSVLSVPVAIIPLVGYGLLIHRLVR
jgi:hypothetical protein